MEDGSHHGVLDKRTAGSSQVMKLLQSVSVGQESCAIEGGKHEHSVYGPIAIKNVGHLVRAATLVTVIHTVFENSKLEDGRFSCHLGKWGLKKNTVLCGSLHDLETICSSNNVICWVVKQAK